MGDRYPDCLEVLSVCHVVHVDGVHSVKFRFAFALCVSVGTRKLGETIWWLQSKQKLSLSVCIRDIVGPEDAFNLEIKKGLI